MDHSPARLDPRNTVPFGVTTLRAFAAIWTRVVNRMNHQNSGLVALPVKTA
jgi:hypothetical protein